MGLTWMTWLERISRTAVVLDDLPLITTLRV